MIRFFEDERESGAREGRDRCSACSCRGHTEESYYRLLRLILALSFLPLSLPAVEGARMRSKPRNYGGIAYVHCVFDAILNEPRVYQSDLTFILVYIIAGRDTQSGGVRMDVRARRQNARSCIQREILKEITACDRRMHSLLPPFRNALLCSTGVNTLAVLSSKCFRVAGAKTCLFMRRETRASGATSDFNRGPIDRSDARPLNFSRC